MSRLQPTGQRHLCPREPPTPRLFRDPQQASPGGAARPLGAPGVLRAPARPPHPHNRPAAAGAAPAPRHARRHRPGPPATAPNGHQRLPTAEAGDGDGGGGGGAQPRTHRLTTPALILICLRRGSAMAGAARAGAQQR